MIDDLLLEKNKIWQALPRNHAEEIAAADRYFDEALMPLAKEKFIAAYPAEGLPDYYGMILTLGTSWQPLALSIAVLQPQRIFVLCTEETLPLLADLARFLQLPPEAYHFASVGRSDAAAVYRAVRDVYEKWRTGGRICMDITGGTKAMASSAAMIGALLDIDLYYVESKYLPVYRRPEAGSERLERLPNPRL